MRHDYGKTTACRRLNELTINSFGAALSILVAAAVTLSACGSDNKADNKATGGSSAPHTSSANISCGGKPTLKASGSTAQENAMTRFVKAFEQACPGQSLNYTPNGSGAGISDFLGGLAHEGMATAAESFVSKSKELLKEQRANYPSYSFV